MSTKSFPDLKVLPRNNFEDSNNLKELSLHCLVFKQSLYLVLFRIFHVLNSKINILGVADISGELLKDKFRESVA